MKGTRYNLIDDLNSMRNSINYPSEVDKMIDHIIKRAKAGDYHDYESNLDFPKMTLVDDLLKAGLVNIAQKANDGGYDDDPFEKAGKINER